MLLCQIQDEKLFDLELGARLTGLCSRLRSCPSHFCPNSHQEVDLDDEHSFTGLHLLHKCLLSLNLSLQLIDASLANIEVETFLDELSDVDHLVLLVVLQTVFEFTLLRG